MNSVSNQTKEALIDRFNLCHGEFMAAAKASEPLLVTQVGKVAEMGVLIKELIGCDSVTRVRLVDWLSRNPGRLCEDSIDWLMNYVAVSNKIGQIEFKFQDIPKTVMQIVFQCAGLLPAETGREIEQTSRALPPATMAWKFRSDLEKHFGNLLKGSGDWDEAQCESVRNEISKAKSYLAVLEDKL